MPLTNPQKWGLGVGIFILLILVIYVINDKLVSPAVPTTLTKTVAVPSSDKLSNVYGKPFILSSAELLTSPNGNYNMWFDGDELILTGVGMFSKKSFGTVKKATKPSFGISVEGVLSVSTAVDKVDQILRKNVASLELSDAGIVTIVDADGARSVFTGIDDFAAAAASAPAAAAKP